MLAGTRRVQFLRVQWAFTTSGDVKKICFEDSPSQVATGATVLVRRKLGAWCNRTRIVGSHSSIKIIAS